MKKTLEWLDETSSAGDVFAYTHPLTTRRDARIVSGSRRPSPLQIAAEYVRLRQQWAAAQPGRLAIHPCGGIRVYDGDRPYEFLLREDGTLVPVLLDWQLVSQQPFHQHECPNCGYKTTCNLVHAVPDLEPCIKCHAAR